MFEFNFGRCSTTISSVGINRHITTKKKSLRLYVCVSRKFGKMDSYSFLKKIFLGTDCCHLIVSNSKIFHEHCHKSTSRNKCTTNGREYNKTIYTWGSRLLSYCIAFAVNWSNVLCNTTNGVIVIIFGYCLCFLFELFSELYRPVPVLFKDMPGVRLCWFYIFYNTYNRFNTFGCLNRAYLFPSLLSVLSMAINIFPNASPYHTAHRTPHTAHTVTSRELIAAYRIVFGIFKTCAHDNHLEWEAYTRTSTQTSYINSLFIRDNCSCFPVVVFISIARWLYASFTPPLFHPSSLLVTLLPNDCLQK